jgi:hypothetical protein
VSDIRKLINLIESIENDQQGWELLQSIKEKGLAHGNQLAGSYQLFMPHDLSKDMNAVWNQRLRRLHMLQFDHIYDRSGRQHKDLDAYIKTGQLPRGVWEISPKNYVDEAAILTPGKATLSTRWNKPSAIESWFWTSTARKTSDGKWTSDWVEFVKNHTERGRGLAFAVPEHWTNSKGYLYKVKPRGMILSYHSDRQADELAKAFELLGRYERPKDRAGKVNQFDLTDNYPWDLVGRHFDAIHYNPKYMHQRIENQWDVESTAWLDTSFLQLVGEVDIDLTYHDESEKIDTSKFPRRDDWGVAMQAARDKSPKDHLGRIRTKDYDDNFQQMFGKDKQ